MIEYNKISKSPTNVKAVLNMPHSKNVPELRRFLGMITYYSRFLPNLSSTTSFPLQTFLRKNQNYRWAANCEAAFIKLKNRMSGPWGGGKRS